MVCLCEVGLEMCVVVGEEWLISEKMFYWLLNGEYVYWKSGGRM